MTTATADQDTAEMTDTLSYAQAQRAAKTLVHHELDEEARSTFRTVLGKMYEVELEGADEAANFLAYRWTAEDRSGWFDQFEDNRQGIVRFGYWLLYWETNMACADIAELMREGELDTDLKAAQNTVGRIVGPCTMQHPCTGCGSPVEVTFTSRGRRSRYGDYSRDGLCDECMEEQKQKVTRSRSRSYDQSAAYLRGDVKAAVTDGPLNVGSCKQCGQDILWATSHKENPIPLDPQPVPYKAGGRYMLYLGDGVAWHVSPCPDVEGEPGPDDQFYRPHVAVCEPS